MDTRTAPAVTGTTTSATARSRRPEGGGETAPGTEEAALG
jgi:hypothetical protein